MHKSSTWSIAPRVGIESARRIYYAPNRTRMAIGFGLLSVTFAGSMSSSNNPLEICRLSVEHAKSHIDEIDVLTARFVESQPYTLVVEDDPLYPTHELRFLRPTKSLPYRISGLAGDALVNLRNSLDHAGYFVAVAAGKGGKNAHFPFGDTVVDLEGNRKRRSKDIPKEMFDFMAAFKPFRDGNVSLWTLNKLAGSKKHEPLLRAEMHVFEIIIDSDATQLTLDPMLNKIHHPRSNGDMPVGWRRKSDPERHENFEVAILVRFNDAIALGKPATALLRDFSRVVERVLSGIEAEARRLGLFT